IYFDLAGPKLRTGGIAIKENKKRKVKEGFILLHKKEYLHLHRKSILGKWAKKSKDKLIIKNAKISCSIPEILDKVNPGEKILFDDGKIEGEILEVKEDYLIIEVTNANPKGSKLKAEKGINLPDTNLNLPCLTEEDLIHLDYVVQHADIIGY